MTSISDTNVVNAPGGLVEVAFQQRTTDYITSSTTVAGASNVFSSNATFIADGSPYLVDFFCGRITTYGPYTNIFLVDGSGNSQGMFGLVFPGDNQVPGFYRYRFVPSAGSVVNLNIRGIVNTTGSATYSAGDGGTGTGNQVPMQLRVSKIIQASQLIVQTPNAPLVTSLPSNAIDGQEVRYLADNTNGIIWNFRYRAGSSSAYKWEFIGGPPIGSLNTGSQSVAANTGTVTASPSLSIALPGDYRVDYGGLTATGTGTGGQYAVIAPAYGGVSLGQDHEIGAAGNTSYVTCAASRSFTFATANTLALNHRVDVSAGTSFFLRRYIRITPIRVSA